MIEFNSFLVFSLATALLLASELNSPILIHFYLSEPNQLLFKENQSSFEVFLLKTLVIIFMIAPIVFLINLFAISNL